MKGVSSIPQKLNKEMDADPFYTTCCLYGQSGHVCDGRLTRDHALIWAGQQINKRWAILPVCERGHGVDNFQDAGDTTKEVREWVALSRATDADLMALSGDVSVGPLSKCLPMIRHKEYLSKKYGVYSRKMPPEYPNKPKTSTVSVTSPFQPKWHPLTDNEVKKLEFAREFYNHVCDMPLDIRAMVEFIISEHDKMIKSMLDYPEIAGARGPHIVEKLKTFKPEK